MAHDGKTSPFGDGYGNTSGGRAAPSNFLRNPRGVVDSSVKPRDFRTDQKVPTTSTVGVNPDSVASAGILPQIDPPDSPEIGTRPLGQNAHKPYKLEG